MSSGPAKLGEYVGRGGWTEARECKGGMPGLLHGWAWFVFDRGPSFAEVEALQGTRVPFVVDEVERQVLVSSVRVDSGTYSAKLRHSERGE